MNRKKLSNQQRRARKDLLEAASRLMGAGRKPTMEEVAEEAMVSRATAYRYFKNVDALLVEAPIDAALESPEAVFATVDTQDPAERIDVAEASMHRVTYDQEVALRVMLANSIGLTAEKGDAPKRQNRRVPMIETALAPARERISDENYDRLVPALAALFGPEAMIVFKDVLQIDEQTARSVKSWAVRALVRSAMD